MIIDHTYTSKNLMTVDLKRENEFPAKLELTQRTILQTRTKHESPTHYGSKTNNELTLTESLDYAIVKANNVLFSYHKVIQEKSYCKNYQIYNYPIPPNMKRYSWAYK